MGPRSPVLLISTSFCRFVEEEEKTLLGVNSMLPHTLQNVGRKH